MNQLTVVRLIMNKEILKNLRILYVEDEDDVREFTGKILKTIVKEAILAENGLVGLEQFKQNQDIDLIVTDINMPKMNGFEMCMEIKKYNSSIPIVITSAHNDPNFLKEAIDVGVNAYAMKPIDLYQLIDNMIRAVEPFYLKKQLEEMNQSLQNRVEEGIKQIKAILDSQDNLVMVLNQQQVINANKPLLEFFNFDSLQDLQNTDFCICNYFEEAEGYFNKTSITNNKDWVTYMVEHLNNIDKIVKIKDQNNHTKIFTVNIDKIEDEQQNYVISLTDITEIKEESTLLEYQATHDTLTGLYNRQKFHDIFAKELRRDKRYNNALSLIIFDIDHFKNVNDEFGHQVGDEVLKDISALIQQAIREHDTVVRWGGEEFIILLPETNLEGAMNTAQKLKDTICNYKNSSINRTITASFGLTVLQEKDNQDSVIKRADDALYKAKQSGRNKIVSA